MHLTSKNKVDLGHTASKMFIIVPAHVSEGNDQVAFLQASINNKHIATNPTNN